MQPELETAALEAQANSDTNIDIENRYFKGLNDGIPIGLGYLSVSFTFGIVAVMGGLPVWAALLISMTNVTSAGQFAGLSLMLGGASYLEVAMTQVVINMRYALMSVSLSQKLNRVGTFNRMGIAFCVTDEIFAVSATNPKNLGSRYMYGLMSAPYAGWVLGTLIGAAAGMLLPESVRSALGIAIYGMFIAIVIPPSKKNRVILWVLLGSAALSCCFNWLPLINRVSSGFVIIICAVICAGLGAAFAPVKDEN